MPQIIEEQPRPDRSSPAHLCRCRMKLPTKRLCRATPARPKAEARFMRATSSGGNRLSGLVMMRERGKHLGAAHPLLEHLRRGFDKIRFHADAADSRPLLLAAEDVVHQVAELVEESDHLAVFHQAGIGRRRRREIANQNRFRQLLAANSVQYRRHLAHGCTCRAGDACRDKTGRSALPFSITSQVSTEGSHAGTFSSWRKVTWKSVAAVSMIPFFTWSYGR